MNEAKDGEHGSLAPESGRGSAGSIDDPKLNLLAEELEVAKEAVETGRVRVSKQTHTREALIDETLFHEHAEIETVPIGRQILEMPSIRHEGDTTIVPIVEEVLYTERKLVLKEEVRITRRRASEQFRDHVTLRYQEAVITRVQAAPEQADAASAKPTEPREQKNDL